MNKLLLLLLCLSTSALTFAARKAEYIVPPAPADQRFSDVKSLYNLPEMNKAFAQHNRILIGNYRVGYTVAKSAYAREAGGSQTENIGSNGWQTVRTFKDQELRATVELSGVDSDDLFAITQAGYEDLMARLKAAGREIVTMDQISDSTVIRDKLELSTLNGDGEYWTNIGIGEARELMLVTHPKAIPLWFMFGDTLDAGASMKAAFNALSMKNFSFIKEISGEQNAGMLDISVTVRFADAWSLRGKTLRKAQVGVVPKMTLSLNKVSLTTAKVTKVGIYPGPSGSIQGFKKLKGFDLGSNWATYNRDVTHEDSWSTTGQTIELEVTTDPEHMKEAVMQALTSLNASIALLAAEYPPK